MENGGFYDISKYKNNQRNNFRRILKQVHFFRLQKSVYLSPYSCSEQIEFLREYFGVGEDVQIITADKLENESVYKQYFGL
jgi:CRISPR-associated endonuclease Cas2